jgi:hypothetical protein
MAKFFTKTFFAMFLSEQPPFQSKYEADPVVANQARRDSIRPAVQGAFGPNQ